MGNKLYYYKECEEVFFISRVIPKSINLNNIKNNAGINATSFISGTSNINNKYTRE